MGQKGNSLIAVLVAVLIMGAICVAGWYVVRSQEKGDKTQAPLSQASDSSTGEAQKAPIVSDIEPIPGGTGQYDFAKIAKTYVQRDIAEAILGYCKSLDWPGVDEEHAVVAVAQDTLTNEYLYKATSTNARISATCYSTLLPAEDQATGREFLLHKEGNPQQWVVDLATQMEPPCSKVDNLGYADILPKCIIDNTQGETRQPK